MEFGLLGPLTVVSGTDVVTLGGPRQRTVLAHLLLHVNHEVTADQLVDWVWTGDPPPSARASLHAYVSRLRAALGPERLEGHTGRYVLRAHEDEVDALRFAARRAAARRCAASDPAQASALLRSALDLWRDDALVDLADEPSLCGAIARLEADRREAVEEWAELELAVGRAPDVVRVLEDLVARDPFRERAWGQLMLALYRCGRQRDALDAYEHVRRTLADELGLDPWPDLRNLHQQVIRQDLALRQVGRPLRGYRLLQELGRGPCGTVHLAVQPGTGREVAIKIVRPELANSPEFVRRFDTEAQVAARLEHPHVVPLHDYWRDPDGAYLVMRHLRGGSLRDALDAGTLPPERVVCLVEQVAQALSFAHREGVVHRNVKPTNILLDETGDAFLADFGLPWDVRLPRGLDDVARPATSYSAPELAAGGELDGRADTYSLAVVTLEALSGRRPDEGLSVVELCRSLPPGVAGVLTRATSAARAGRPDDVLGFAAELRRAVGTAERRATTGPGAEPAMVRNPYKGLRAFTGADVDDFHGRGRMVADMLSRMGEDAASSRFVAVVGPSGGGKSSLVAAGLLPALRAGALPGSEGWFVAEMHPGEHPFDELALALTTVAARLRPGLAADIRGGPGIARVLPSILPEPGRDLLLVVDQFEEVFILVEDEGERNDFLALLAGVATDGDVMCRVVVTLRADFYDQPLAHPAVAELVGAGTVTVVPLTPHELERAIAAPARGVGVEVEPALLATLVADVGDQPASLPLLQYALTELFDLREGGPLGLATYERIGGLSGALAKRAEELHRGLEPASRHVVRQLFLHLVTLGDEGAPATRRRVMRTELASLGGTPEAMDAAVEAFASGRLLTVDRDPVTRSPTVEVAHEALLREWHRLRGWIDEARGEVVLHGRLVAASREWLEAGRDDSALLRGDRLRRFETWVRTSSIALGTHERELLAASIGRREDDERRESDRATHEHLLERRSLVRLRVALSVVALGALVASVLTLVALDQRGRAQTQARAAAARELAAASLANLDQDPELSTLLALEAVATTRDRGSGVLREAEEALHRSVHTNRVVRSWPHGGGAVAVIADGQVVTTGTGGDPPRVWDVASGDQISSIDAAGPATFVAASPDLSLLAVSGDDGVQVVDVRSGAVVRDLPAPDVVRHPTFTAGGRRVVGLTDNAVRVWRVSDGRVVAVLRDDGALLQSLTVSPREPLVVTGDEQGWVKAWDLDTGRLLHAVRRHEWPVMSVAFSPDGRRLASASYDAHVRLWNPRTFSVEGTIATGTPFQDVSFSPDGQRLLTAATDAVATVWRVATGQQLVRLVGHGGGLVADASFLPDGEHVVTSSVDGTTRLWDAGPRGAREWLTVPGVKQIYAGVAFSPDGSLFAAPAHPTGVNLWDATTGEEVMSLRGTTRKLTTVVFSPDGRMLAAGSDVTNRPPVWDVRTGRLLHHLEGHAGSVRAVTFSPDGRRILTGGRDGTLRTWDAASGRQLGEPVRGRAEVFAVAFAPDGRLVVGEGSRIIVRDPSSLDVERELLGHGDLVTGLAFEGTALVSASFDGTARVWDLDTGRERLVFRGHRGPVNQAALAPAGDVVATSGEDGTTRLWDLDTGVERLTLLGHSSLVFGTSFSPDGRLLATASPDGTVALRVLQVDELVELARSRLTRTLSEEECLTHLHSECS